MNPQPLPDAANAQQTAELANNAMLEAIRRYARNNDDATARIIRLAQARREAGL